MTRKTGQATLSVRHVEPKAQRDTRDVDPKSLHHSWGLQARTIQSYDAVNKTACNVCMSCHC